MTEQLSKGGQRFLAVAILGLAGALLWSGLVGPLLGFVDAMAGKRRGELASLSRDRAVLMQDPKVQSALRSVKDSARWNRLYLFDRPDQAVLQFETDLRDLLKPVTAPSSMTAVPTVSQGSLNRMGVKMTLSMPIDQWSELLARMRSHPKLLQLRNVTVRVPDYQPVDSNPIMSIQAEFVGYSFNMANSRS